jgi:hypothetical protein
MVRLYASREVTCTGRVLTPPRPPSPADTLHSRHSTMRRTDYGTVSDDADLGIATPNDLACYSVSETSRRCGAGLPV